MRKSRFTEEQIVAILKEGEAGVPVADLLRRHGISRATYFLGRSKDAGTTGSELKRSKALEGENAKRKRMYAELALANTAITDVLQRKRGRRPRDARCARSWSRRISSRCDPRAGRSGCPGRRGIGGRSSRRRGIGRCGRRCWPSSSSTVAGASGSASTGYGSWGIAGNGVWALDFMPDALYGGRPFRTLNILDEANREALGSEVGHAIPAERVVRVLEQLIAIHGRPAAFRLDNGPECPAQAFTAWCDAQGITLLYIQPGKPDHNAFIERFNRTYRTEVLAAYVFEAISEVQTLPDEWLPTYNDDRPHDALGRIPPTRFLSRPTTPPESHNAWCP